MGLNLDERYQIEIYEEIKQAIAQRNRAAIIMPPGTGKTFEALKLIEDNLDKAVVYITPSPKINVYIRKQIRSIYGKEADKILSKITFKTYHGLMREYKTHPADLKANGADIIIEDEAHRAGAKEWGKAVEYLEEINPNAIRLAMTATPIRSDGRNMLEEKCGEIDYHFKLTDAIARGVLALPKWVCARYIFEEDIQRIEGKIAKIADEKERKSWEDKLEKAKRSLAKAEGVDKILARHMEDKNGKWLVFCNIGDDIEKLQEEAIQKNWYSTVNPNYILLNVESINSDIENAYALRQFSKPNGEDLRILYSKNMLNEGIHDEDITGEIMLRPTKSYILFMQQVGRILSRNRTETPIVLDLVGNIRYFEQFRQEIISTIQEHKGDRRYLQSTREFEDFRIIEETNDFIKSFEQIEARLDECLNKSAISQTLDVLEILQREGIEVTKIKQRKQLNDKHVGTTLEDINQEGIDIGAIIQKYSLDKNFPIGMRISVILSTYKGKKTYTITEEDKQRIEQLGFCQKKSSTTETLDVLEILQRAGIDVTKIKQTRIVNGKQVSTTLEDIKQKGIDIEAIIQEHGLDKNFPIGKRLANMLQAYKGTGNYAINEPNKRRMEQLGLVNTKKTSIEETLDVLEILQREGIYVTKIKKQKKIEGKPVFTTLQDINQEGMDIRAITQEYGLDTNFLIGFRLKRMLNAYKGKGGYTITESDKRRMEQLGLVSIADMEAEQKRLQEKLEKAEALKQEAEAQAGKAK